MVTTLGQQLGELRRRVFVGRDEELTRFRDALATSGVIFLHGPGGVGKSTLLDTYARLATDAGRTVLRIDARHVTLGPDGLPRPGGDRPVLLIDTYELLAPVDDWVREQYLPSLPADTLVVLAGRHAPGPRWRADPAWRELLRARELGNLTPRAGRDYLALQDVPEDARDRLLQLSHGHPLTLSLLVDAVRRGCDPRTLADLPDVVGALLALLVDQAPSPRHRDALEVCAHLPVTTEDLLRSVAGDEAGPLFAWLRTLSFVSEGPHGLFPHDIVRDALDADHRWRDPAHYARLSRTLDAAVLARIHATADRRERLRLVIDHTVVAGARSRVTTCRTPAPTMQAYVDELRDGDRAPIIAMTARWQGQEQAGHVARWLDRAPEAFQVFRTPSGEPRGFAACLDLTPDDGGDPGAAAMWHYVQQAPPRAGERVRAWRFFLDRDHGQSSSPSVTLFVACQTLDNITLGGTAWTLIGAYADPELWAPTMDNLDFWHAPSAGYTVGGTHYPVFAHDWRRTDIAEWLTLVHDRQSGTPTRPTAEPTTGVVLTLPAFTDAVRAALRDLRDPARLRENPLQGARLLRRDEGRTLRDLIEAGTAALPPAAAELITRTFLHPGTTQERVAASLHLSYNTYRRRRDEAVAGLTEWLWEREISGS
ncbi:ATP-binding protein [Catenuloplanes japonicus]|uniref:ATP-binding protein n=1 Tax=Catenuloplanes japonicus TaxID=33876 RepID=UPI00052506FA|nr:ATP-binding protein [Catenuloplanes japonicus]